MQFVVRNNDWFSGGNGDTGGRITDDAMNDADTTKSINYSMAAVTADNQNKGIDNTVGNTVLKMIPGLSKRWNTG